MGKTGCQTLYMRQVPLIWVGAVVDKQLFPCSKDSLNVAQNQCSGFVVLRNINVLALDLLVSDGKAVQVQNCLRYTRYRHIQKENSGSSCYGIENYLRKILPLAKVTGMLLSRKRNLKSSEIRASLFAKMTALKTPATPVKFVLF